MATEQQVKVVISGEDKTGPAFKSASKSAGFLKTDVTALSKTILGATVAIGGLAVGLGVSAVKSAIEAQNSIAQLNAVLKSTGNAAGFTTDQILEQASALQSLTTFSDEAIGSAQNLLLTFTKVQGPVFEEATKTILDMSVALGQDLKSSAIQVGKALNDPILGVSALRRVGVSFTEDQQKMIQTLVESGQVMEAQKFILKELAVEFGGSASAAADTFEGKIKQMNNTIDDLKEIVGNALIEALSPFMEQLSTWATNPDVQLKVREIAKVVGEYLVPAIEIAIETVRLWYVGFQAVTNVIGEIIFQVDRAISAIARFKSAAEGVIGSAGKATGSAVSSIVKTITGKRAEGGSVMSGGSYLVGEKGPEIFRPQSSGFIIPNGGGSAVINLYVTGNTLLDGDAGEKIGKQIMNTLKANLRI